MTELATTNDELRVLLKNKDTAVQKTSGDLSAKEAKLHQMSTNLTAAEEKLAEFKVYIYT